MEVYGSSLGFYSFLLGASLTMLFKINTDGMANLWPNIFISSLVGLLFLALSKVIPEGIEIVLGAYYEAKNRQPDDSPDPESESQAASSVNDEINNYMDYIDTILSDSTLKIDRNTLVRFSEEEAMVIRHIILQRWVGNYEDYLPVTSGISSIIPKLEDYGLATTDGINGNTRYMLTDSGKQLFRTAK